MPELHGAVILATHNCSGSIATVLAELEEATSVLRRSGVDLHVLLVDDSTDHTADIGRDEAARLGLKLEVLGLGDATPGWTNMPEAHLAGFRHGLAVGPPDFFVTLDADGKHDARQITDLVRSFVTRGSGITIGSRWVRGGSAPGTSLMRSVVSRAANRLARSLAGISRVRDATTSFRVVAPEVAQLLLDDDVPTDGYGFFAASVAYARAAGFSVDEVPITYRPRYVDATALSPGDVRRFVAALWQTRSHARRILRRERQDMATWVGRSGRMRSQAAAQDSQFGAATELTHLAAADNFFGWIVDEIEPHLGSRILEVGAGLGTVALKLAAARPDGEVLAIEPAANLCAELEANVAGVPNLTARPITSGDLLAEIGPAAFDSLVYVNVLEHILDEQAELATAHALLRPGGTVSIFVPALAGLYGSLDYKSGHHRRYDRDGLREVITRAGFDVVDLRYLDMAGVFPYWLMYRVLDRKSLDSMSSNVYDRLIVPVAKTAQRIIPNPPFGKNLLVVARRRSA